MPNLTKPPKIRITRKERRTGKIDPAKLPQQKKVVIKLNAPAGTSGADLYHQRGTEKTSYEKKDVRTGDPNYGKESKTAPTPEFVRKAQRAGAEHAEHKGKSYAAGTSTTTKTPDKHVKIKLHPELKMVKHQPHEGKETGAGKDRITQSSGPVKKRRLERVKWLQGRNKRTEAGHGR